MAGVPIEYFDNTYYENFRAFLDRQLKEEESKELKRKAQEARELTKKLEQKRLMKDPDYLKLLELKEKFKGK